MYDIIQRVSEVHEYRCPSCNEICTRQWHTPQINVSEGGFFSATLGRHVKDYREFDRELDRTRYMTRMEKHLRRDSGYNKPPEQEWVDAREKKEKKAREKAERDWSESVEWGEKVRKRQE